MDSVARELLLYYAPGFGLSIEELKKGIFSIKAEKVRSEVIESLGLKPLKRGGILYFVLKDKAQFGVIRDN